MASTPSNPIREARKRKGFSQRELARLLGVTKGAVSQWENGSVMPVPATAKRLTKLLPITLDRIYRSAA